MNLLVLGGTIFLGRHIVEAALARGHAVTIFHRGRHGAGLFPGVDVLHGDRGGDLAALGGHTWDAVIDTSGFRPEQVRATAQALGGSVEHYTFISSISVFAAFPPGRAFDEDAPRAEGDDGYGALKARCEDVLDDLLPGRVACVRPGLIVGPHDPTGRFTYWPRRVARGGVVLAPGRPERPVQIVDARDLADWCVRLAERRQTGVFNATGPVTVLTMEQVLDTCRAVAGSDARFAWVPDEALLSAGVVPWTELPLWIPEGDPSFGGMLLAESRRAIAAGLMFRPLAESVRDTLAWDRSEGEAPADSPIRVMPLTPERESELLAQHALQRRT